MLLFRQQETVAGLDGLTLLHVVQLPDLTPAVTVAEMTHRQIGKTFVAGDHASLAWLAGMDQESCINKVSTIPGPLYLTAKSRDDMSASSGSGPSL